MEVPPYAADDRVVMGYRGCDRGFGPDTDGFGAVMAEANVIALLGSDMFYTPRSAATAIS